eukprot:1833682-Pyramimonas_sp.AAC.1
MPATGCTSACVHLAGSLLHWCGLASSCSMTLQVPVATLERVDLNGDIQPRCFLRCKPNALPNPIIFPTPLVLNSIPKYKRRASNAAALPL